MKNEIAAAVRGQLAADSEDALFVLLTVIGAHAGARLLCRSAFLQLEPCGPVAHKGGYGALAGLGALFVWEVRAVVKERA